MRVIDHIQERKRQGKVPYYSFEYFPPKTEEGKVNLKDRVERMVGDLDPLFIDVTWGAGGSTSEASLQVSHWLQTYSGAEVMMHLTLTNMSLEDLDSALEKAKELGINNILALRGDPPSGQERWVPPGAGLEYASDLVRYIKQKYGDYFGVAVAGYAEGHIDCETRDQDIRNLKTKVDAGADLVITQFFYDVDTFLDFVDRCREIGITCPIIPGIMPIQNYQGFHKMTTFCQTKVPQEILDKLEEIKDDEDAVKDYGVELGTKMVKKMIDHGIEGFHFYTLNLERTVRRTLENLNIIQKERDTPWRKVATRQTEGVRPIFWNYRPKSYIDRTYSWDDYPNGRWGDSRSPAFGFSYPMERYPLYTLKQQESLIKKWGTPTSIEDIEEVFVKFLKHEIDRLPWYEEIVDKETLIIQNLLQNMNRKGLLTLNSQPQVNGLPSSNPGVGWGPTKPEGYIYQRAYIEFFSPQNKVEDIIEELSKNPTISYVATDIQGSLKTNIPEGTTIAATWGVFPNREVVQPTIVDRDVFYNWWSKEAFNVWLNEWGSLYEKDSESYNLLKSIHDTYYLFMVVENDYIKGDIEKVFERVLERLS